MKILKSRIFAFALGAIIFSGITAVVALNIDATEVEYNGSTVDTALNDLYDVANSSVFNSITIRLRSGANSSTKSGQSDIQNLNSLSTVYKHFKFNTLVKSNDNNTCKLVGYSALQSTWIQLTTGTTYNLFDENDGYKFQAIGIITNSYADAWGTCMSDLIFFND